MLIIGNVVENVRKACNVKTGHAQDQTKSNTNYNTIIMS